MTAIDYAALMERLRDYSRTDTDALMDEAADALERLTQPVPDGWQLVPKTPTSKMCHAAFTDRNGNFSSESQYKAMLAAAPEAPAEAQCNHDCNQGRNCTCGGGK